MFMKRNHLDDSRTMRVSDWMCKPAITAKPRENALHARATLEQKRINQLPVVVNGKLVGIVTDRDLRDAFPSVFESAAAKPREQGSPDPERILIESLMTRRVTTIGQADSVVDAARIMREQRIGALPVVEDGHLVGIITRSDLLDALVALAGGLVALTAD